MHALRGLVDRHVGAAYGALISARLDLNKDDLKKQFEDELRLLIPLMSEALTLMYKH